MRRLAELNNIQLLYEVKEHVMRPRERLTEEIEDSEVGCLVNFADSAWKKGIEGLEMEEDKIWVEHNEREVDVIVLSAVKYV